MPTSPHSNAERLSLALAAAKLGDWHWDAGTDVVTFSDRAAEIFGVPPGPHMTWSAMRALLHPHDREPARVAVEDALAAHADYIIDYRLVNGGRERWVSASGRGRYTDGGEVLGMFGVVQDITRDRLLTHIDDARRALHGGRVTAHSKGDGKGSELVVRLPSVRASLPPRDARAPAPRLELGGTALHHMVKPVDLNTLVATLGTALASKTESRG